VGQRLLRKVCPQCSERDHPEQSLIRALGVPEEVIRRANFRRGRGCQKCNGRGYRGRAAAYEVMRMSEPIRNAVLSNAGGSVLKQLARADGMMTMREAGVRKVLEGETTIDEVYRVLMSEEAGDQEIEFGKAA